MSAALKPENELGGEATAIARQERSGAIKAATEFKSNSVGELLNNAISMGTPVEQLDKLVDLYERVEAREAAKDFARAMAAFQAEAQSIEQSKTANVKTKSGSSYSYTYAPLHKIAQTVNPLLTKHGLSYTWDTAIVERTVKVTCTVRHVSGHSQASSFQLPIENPNTPGMSPQQLVEAAESIGKRRVLASALGLTTTDEELPPGVDDARVITEDQAIVIEDLLAETGVNKARFLKWLEADSVQQILSGDYERAKRTLEEKKENKS